MTDKIRHTIAHHAVMFALLAKHAVLLCGTRGREAVLEGVTRYGNERGKRMAENALSNGDDLTLLTSQVYGEWKPDFEGQMEFGVIQNEPSLRTYISKCAWCKAWQKYGLLEYGMLNCINIDNAVYQGFMDGVRCTPVTEAMSFGGKRCEFDWGRPLTDAEMRVLAEKKEEAGDRFVKDFTFHTRHIRETVSRTLISLLGDEGRKAVENAVNEYIEIFGKEFLC